MKLWNNICFGIRNLFKDQKDRFIEENSSLFSGGKGCVLIIVILIVIPLLGFLGYKGYQKYLEHDYTLRAEATYQAQYYKEALKNYEALARLDNVDAIVMVAQMYLDGKGTAKDQKKAIDYLHKAAQLGSTEAMTKLGKLYYASGFVNRTCLGRDYQKAHAWFVKAGKNADALDALGHMYKEGLGVEKNEQLAHKYFDEWISLYASKAQAGDKEAQFQLGNFYLDGLHHSSNEELALQWLEKSAEQDYIPALEILAPIYLYGGEKIQAMPDKAQKLYARLIELYKKEALDGKVDSMIALSSIYSIGTGVERDLEMSVKYLLDAYNKESIEACEILADLVEREKISLPNGLTAQELKDTILILKENEASKGNIAAMNELGFRALNKNNVEIDLYTGYERVVIDYISAIKWFTLAADAGDAQAMLELGKIYNETTDPGIKSMDLTIHWFNKSAEQCYEPAYFELGALYSKPNTPIENIKTSQYWYELAATQGTQEAQMILAKSLAKGGKGAQPDYINALKWLLVVKLGNDNSENKDLELESEILELEAQYSHYLTPEEVNNVKKSAENMRKQYGTRW